MALFAQLDITEADRPNRNIAVHDTATIGRDNDNDIVLESMTVSRCHALLLREANELTVTFAMIETRTALDNVEAIAATPGIDGLFLGPADLSIALSNGANVDPMSGEVDRELDRITAAATKAGKVMGAYCHSAERAVALAKRGVRFLAVGSDMGFLRAGAAAALKALKS